MGYSLGIDTGGTHTDLILVDRKVGQTWTAKVPTTPTDPLKGILRGIDRVLTQSKNDISELDELIYGTTIVTNMLVEHQKVKTALMTTRGFRDVLEIGRAYRTGNIYDIQFERQPPLVPRHLRMEITERINFRGEVLEQLDEENCRAVVRELKAYGVTSIAVCFLHSYINPQHERRARVIIEEEYPRVYVSLSSDINPVFREYERTSTTVVNAYVTPRMVEHLDDFERRVVQKGLRSRLYTMQANGGRATFRTACRTARCRKTSSSACARTVAPRLPRFCWKPCSRSRLQWLSGSRHNFGPIAFSTIVPTGSPSRVPLVWECKAPWISRRAAEVGLVGCLELLPEALQPPEGSESFATAFAALEERARWGELSTTTAVLALAARKRGLPCEAMRGPYLRLGHGASQRLIYASVTDHTSLAASQLAHNKHRTNRRLAELHLPIARQIKVATTAEALAAADTLGYPVVIKPLKEKQATGVSVGIASANAVRAAFESARQASQRVDQRVIVEEFVRGHAHRLLVVGGRFLAALKTIPPTVTGDGSRTIAELVEELNRDPLRNGVRLFKRWQRPRATMEPQAPCEFPCESS